MVRGKTFFTVGSIISMTLTFFTLFFGFVEDGYYYGYYYYDFYSRSFSENYEELYIPLFLAVTVMIGLGVVAIILYNKRITAINIVNLIFSILVYLYAAFVAIIALIQGHEVFGVFLLLIVVGVCFPFHLVVNIIGLAAKKPKPQPQAQPAYGYAPQQGYAQSQQGYGYAPQQGYNAPQQSYAPQHGYGYAPQQGYNAPQQGYNPQQGYGYGYAPQQGYAQPQQSAPVNAEALDALKQLKELYDKGILTEAEYNAKRSEILMKI